MSVYPLDRPKTYAWLAGLVLATGSLLAHAADAEPVRIGWVNWSDTEITAKLAQTALQDQLKQPVKMVQADIGIQFQALANGNIDLIPMVWLPNTHKGYWDKYKDQLEDLGVLYEGRIGWAVPDSVPVSEVSSIEDLNKPQVRETFGSRILTSEAGNGQYKLSLKAIDDYTLTGYKLVASSKPACSPRWIAVCAAVSGRSSTPGTRTGCFPSGSCATSTTPRACSAAPSRSMRWRARASAGNTRKWRTSSPITRCRWPSLKTS